MQPTSRASRVPALVRATRPRQWTKNLLVVLAPLASGDLLDHLGPVVLAFVVFTLAASGVYLVNDVLDVEADRQHPVKQHRPIASGAVAPRTAVAVAVVLEALALVVAALVDQDLLVTVAVYLVLQLAYAVRLKHEPVIDIAIVSSGFLLRAIAGGVATDVPLSQWFLLVAAFGSLFIVAGKRYSELTTVGTDQNTRRSLQAYSVSYLRFVWSLAAAVTVTSYSLWAFELVPTGHVNWQAISVAPFVLGVLRYAVDVDRGLAGEPEDAVARDRVLQVIGVAWIAVFVLGVYG